MAPVFLRVFEITDKLIALACLPNRSSEEDTDVFCVIIS